MIYYYKIYKKQENKHKNMKNNGISINLLIFYKNRMQINYNILLILKIDQTIIMINMI